MQTKSIFFPVRTDEIKKLGKITSFKDADGGLWFGRQFTMALGDNFSHWSQSEEILQMFQEGMHIIYQLVQEPKGDGTFKNKVRAIEVVGNLKTQFAPYVMDEIVKSIHNSVRLTTQLVEADVIDKSAFEQNAKDIHNITKQMLLTENFTLNEQNEEQ
jgi:hypothetical protein